MRRDSDKRTRGEPSVDRSLPAEEAAASADPSSRQSSKSDLLRAAQRLIELGSRSTEAGLTDATIRTYTADWLVFENWCAQAKVPPLPASPHSVALFITSQVELNRGLPTITRRLAAISLAHRAALLSTPTHAKEVKELMKRIRQGCTRPPARKKAALGPDIDAMMGTLDPLSARGVRNRALLLIGFAGGFRRSELVALNVEDLEFGEHGLGVNIIHPIDDRHSHGRRIFIPSDPRSENCPVRALSHWMAIAGVKEGPVFRRMRQNDKVAASRLTDRSVTLIVKECAAKAGLNSEDFSSHSLRRGFLTGAAKRGVRIQEVAHATGLRSWNVLGQYFEETDCLRDHPGAELLK